MKKIKIEIDKYKEKDKLISAVNSYNSQKYISKTIYINTRNQIYLDSCIVSDFLEYVELSELEFRRLLYNSIGQIKEIIKNSQSKHREYSNSINTVEQFLSVFK